MKRLSPAQRRALAEIARGRPIAGNDDGWILPETHRPTLAALERSGAIERQGYDANGVMCGRGYCRITEAGRAALQQEESAP